MNELIKQQMTDVIREFRLPRYHEIPNVGLYLEQTVSYINSYIAPLGCAEITNSMISNYVKKGFVKSPVKKQYYAEQICHLIFISIAKNVLSLENICKLFRMQEGVYSDETAYDYFCSELENMLYYIFGIKEAPEQVGVFFSDQKTMLRGVIISVSHMIHLNSYFAAMDTTDKSLE